MVENDQKVDNTKNNQPYNFTSTNVDCECGKSDMVRWGKRKFRDGTEAQRYRCPSCGRVEQILKELDDKEELKS